MLSLPATLYTRLFRVLVVIGIITACIVAFALNVVDIMGTRSLLIANFRQSLTLAAIAAADDIKRNVPQSLSEMAAMASQINGLEVLCVYDRDNMLVHNWHSQAHPEHCPPLIRESGVHESLSSINIAEPLTNKNSYLGILYAQATLIPVGALLLRAGIILASLLMTALATCATAAHYGARHVNHLIDAMRQQIECLKDQSAECPLPPARATSETAALYDEIRSLRLHLVTSLAPKEAMVHLRRWYENIFFNLAPLLRSRTPADSSCLSLLSDCELLLRLNAEEASPEPTVTDIVQLAEEGFASARALNPPGSQVHLVMSFKPAPVREWKVMAGYLKAMIRHLLLIALARTRKGLICLRLEIVESADADFARLVWRLEDSGPPLQSGVLRSRLTAIPYKMVSVAEASWLLAAQLVKRQHGVIEGENAPGGLLLRGEIRLDYPEHAEWCSPHTASVTAQAQEHPRLILMVAESSTESRAVCGMMESINCHVLWVENPVQALEMAPSLPFSAIILNGFLYDREGHIIMRRMVALMEKKLMPVIPIWVLTVSEAPAEHKAWSAAGATEVLPTSVTPEKMAFLCHRLIPFNRQFWSACDMNLLQEYSRTLEARLPEMRAELMARIAQVQAAIAVPAPTSVSSEVMHDVHGVKSAALALGYMHLAALMANLEYMLASKQVAGVARNIVVLAICLKEIRLE